MSRPITDADLVVEADRNYDLGRKHGKGELQDEIESLRQQVSALTEERDTSREVARKEWSERLRLYDVIDAERNKVESLTAQLSTARERISGALSRLSVITNCDEGMGTHCIDVLCQDVIPLLESVATAKGNTNEAAEGESDG